VIPMHNHLHHNIIVTIIFLMHILTQQEDLDIQIKIPLKFNKFLHMKIGNINMMVNGGILDLFHGICFGFQVHFYFAVLYILKILKMKKEIQPKLFFIIINQDYRYIEVQIFMMVILMMQKSKTSKIKMKRTNNKNYDQQQKKIEHFL
ncbi:hypothetical protein IMG5_005560, partial [Ichthyophthirius multifiliis]